MKKERRTKNTQSRFSSAVCLGIALLATSGEINAQDTLEEQAAPVQTGKDYSFTNVSQPIDNRGTTNNTFVSMTPGFRTHMGQNWYLLGAVEVPVTSNAPYDYQVMSGIMKVY